MNIAASPVLIVGAGMAGLAASNALAAQGVPVLLLEKDDTPGGKMASVEIAGRAIDCGPTVLTMADVFDGLDIALPPIAPAQILARHFWSDCAQLDLHADTGRSMQAIADFAGPEDARGFENFTEAGGAILDALEDSFMRGDKPHSPIDLMWRGGLKGLSGFTRLDPYRSLWKMVSQHFSDPRLRQLFGRYATYCGSSPFQAPATLALIAEVERRGVGLVEGGMRRLADAMLDGAQARGAAAQFGVGVEAVLVEDGRTVGVRMADGRVIRSDTVLLTADAAALADGRFGDQPARGRKPFAPADRSFSAFTVAMLADAVDAPLVRHNIAFSDDSPREFAQLAAGQFPDDPTVYLCAQDRGADAAAAAPRGDEEAMLLVVNAPADGDVHQYSQAEIDRCMNAISNRLQRSGIPVAMDRSRCSISTPSDFERRFPATGGALYGRASHGWMASFQRPGARTGVKGLYCAGGSVHPGAGVPMAALSGKAAVRAIMQSRASTSTSPRAAMPGGMSTPSATADATG